jgi:diamine N-acetyltransferase
VTANVRADPEVDLVPVDSGNWRAVTRVTCAPDQESFVAPVADYLCLCHYGGQWQPWAIVADGAVVGHAMWARDDDGSTWLGGLVIDADEQGKGLGRAAVLAFVERFTAPSGAVNVALSYAPENRVARDLYLGLGFVESGEVEDDEIVARLVRAGDR